MGYWKNQLIAEQVEVGDRVPVPIPAANHVSLQYRNKKIVGPVVMSRITYARQIVLVSVFSMALGVLIGLVF